MNKRLGLAAALVAASLAASFALPAQAVVVGFTGAYAPGTWTSTFAGNLGVNGGQTVINNVMVTIVGGNDVSPNPQNFTPACTNATAGVYGNCEVRFVTTNILSPFSFDWSYLSNDSAGANDDLFGVLINGVRTQLSDPGGAISQSGHLSVSASTSFGWYVNCTDCIEGNAIATITNFQAGAVPEPVTLSLIGVAIAAAGVTRRPRRPYMTRALAA